MEGERAWGHSAAADAAAEAAFPLCVLILQCVCACVCDTDPDLRGNWFACYFFRSAPGVAGWEENKVFGRGEIAGWVPTDGLVMTAKDSRTYSSPSWVVLMVKDGAEGTI